MIVDKGKSTKLSMVLQWPEQETFVSMEIQPDDMNELYLSDEDDATCVDCPVIKPTSDGSNQSAVDQYMPPPITVNQYVSPPIAVNQYVPPPIAVNQYTSPSLAMNQYIPPPVPVSQYVPPPIPYSVDSSAVRSMSNFKPAAFTDHCGPVAGHGGGVVLTSAKSDLPVSLPAGLPVGSLPNLSGQVLVGCQLAPISELTAKFIQDNAAVLQQIMMILVEMVPALAFNPQLLHNTAIDQLLLLEQQRREQLYVRMVLGLVAPETVADTPNSRLAGKPLDGCNALVPERKPTADPPLTDFVTSQGHSAKTSLPSVKSGLESHESEHEEDKWMLQQNSLTKDENQEDAALESEGSVSDISSNKSISIASSSGATLAIHRQGQDTSVDPVSPCLLQPQQRGHKRNSESPSTDIDASQVRSHNGDYRRYPPSGPFDVSAHCSGVEGLSTSHSQRSENSVRSPTNLRYTDCGDGWFSRPSSQYGFQQQIRPTGGQGKKSEYPSGGQGRQSEYPFGGQRRQTENSSSRRGRQPDYLFRPARQSEKLVIKQTGGLKRNVSLQSATSDYSYSDLPVAVNECWEDELDPFGKTAWNVNSNHYSAGTKK